MRAQLARHARAGVAMNRKQALDMAIRNQREKLIQMAKETERKGNEDFADKIRELADQLPQLIKDPGFQPETLPFI